MTFPVGHARLEAPVPHLAENAEKAFATTVDPMAEALEGPVGQQTSERLVVRSPVMETIAEVGNFAKLVNPALLDWDPLNLAGGELWDQSLEATIGFSAPRRVQTRSRGHPGVHRIHTMEANGFACSALLSSRLWMVTFSVGQARFESPVPYLAENAKKALAARVAPTAEPLEGSVSQWTSERLGFRSPVMETTAEVENMLTVAMGEAGVIAETPTTGPTKEWRPMLLVVVLELARQHRHRHQLSCSDVPVRQAIGGVRLESHATLAHRRHTVLTAVMVAAGMTAASSMSEQ